MTKLFLPVAMLVIAVVALIGILQWLSPPIVPRLVMLTTRNSSSILPPNDFAATDAIGLYALDDVLEMSVAHQESATRDQMRNVLKNVKDYDLRPPFYAFWKPTTLIVYVNAIGVRWSHPAASTSVDASLAWLVPEHFDPDVENAQEQLVSVRELLDSVARSSATQKLVVFDCQRSAVQPHFGLATRQFVEAALQDVKEMSARLSSVSVLFACGPDEASWPLRPHGESVFGHFFLRGLSGEADGASSFNTMTDNRVTVVELADYVGQHVEQWTAQNCVARQRPLLVQGDNGKDFAIRTLSARPGADLPATPTLDHDRLAADFGRAYARHFEFALRPSPPADWAPVQWTKAQNHLLLAERLHRAGNPEAASRALEDYQKEIDRLVESYRLIRQTIAGLSPVGGPFLSRCIGDGWPELATGDSGSPAQVVVEQVAVGALSWVDAAQKLGEMARETADLLPPEAQFLRLIAARSPSPPEFNSDPWRKLLTQRLLAEAVAQPHHPLTGNWVWKDIEASDAARRREEDQALLGDWKAVALGSALQRTPDAVAPAYDANRDRKELLTKAVRLRDRLLAELPYWVGFLSRSAQLTTGEASEAGALPFDGIAFPETAARGTRLLIDGLEVLYRELLRDPSAMTGEELKLHLEQLAASNEQAAAQLDRMNRELAKYAASVADERIVAPGGDAWNRIDALLELPFPMVAPTTNRAADVTAAAELRAQLLKRSFEDVPPPGDQATQAPAGASESGRGVDPRSTTENQTATTDTEASSRQPAVEAAPSAAMDYAATSAPASNDERAEIAGMYLRLYSLPFDEKPTATAADGSAIDALLGGALYQRLVALAASAKDAGLDRQSMLRAEVAFRLLRHDLGLDRAIASPTIRLRTAALAEWLAWQAQRVTEDFYASLDDSRPPYFAGLADELLISSARLADVNQFLGAMEQEIPASFEPPAASEIAANVDSPQVHIRRRVDQLVALLERRSLTSTPSEIAFRGNAAETLGVQWDDAKDFPVGTAGIHVDIGGALSGGNSAATDAQFVVPRPEQLATEGTSVPISGYFRGHLLTEQLPLSIVQEFTGPVLNYRPQNVGRGRVRFRASRVDREPINLLFVLDCSGSMGLADASGETRIAALRTVLSRFANVIDTREVRVGIRLFGHRYRDITAPEARTDTQLILPIGGFGPARLHDVLKRLQPVGHSPVFNALIEARRDFDGVGQGRREIILISDGADNWADAGHKPGIDELIDAYRGSRDIRINTVGFNVNVMADFARLQEIAAAGTQEGRCGSVDSADGLLSSLAGLIGLPAYRILKDGKPVPLPAQIGSATDSVELEPGAYDVEVIGAGDDVLARQSIRVLPGDEHVLIFDSGSLRYQAAPAQSARKVAEGGPDQPDLLVLDVRPVADALEVEFGLLQKPDHAEDLSPVSVRVVALTDSGREREWHLKHLPPNVANRHFPLWRVALEGWPAHARQVEIQVAWKDFSIKSVSVPLDWNQRFVERAIIENIKLIKQERETTDIDGVSHSLVSLTFALADSEPGIEDWGVVFAEPLVMVEQAYEATHAMYSVRMVLAEDSVPSEVSLFRTGESPPNRTLTATVPLGENRINP